MAEESFDHLRTYRIESLNVVAHEYRHRDTGARHLHLAANDNNNVFAVAFKTLPTDSTGVAHILEHTTLCGSRRFPVRDPFFMMTRRSLNTFMNAFTGSDWTAYPFASQNAKDFNNLLEVYLDAVFFPTLNDLDFAQEGHRLEFAESQDSGTDLIIKGVVYNEMRGAMSAPVARLWAELSSALFPTTTYHFNSGGEPADIPNLTYAALTEFHQRHYHPSNALFATYGDLDVDDLQHRIHDLALRHFAYSEPPASVPNEQRYAQPRQLTIPYALEDNGDTDHKTHIVIGWLLGQTTDLRELMDMYLLAGALLDHSASPLRHALETSPLGSAPSELCGLESAQREATFVCGVEGSQPQHADAVLQLVMGVINNVVEHGVSHELLASVLHQMEIAQREIRGGSHPYGLHLLEAVMPVALHAGDPIAILAIDPVLDALRKSIEDPAYIKHLASKWLVENPHRVLIVMVPDTQLSAKEALATKERLREIRAGLSADEVQDIVNRAQQLAQRQAVKDDPDVLPRVTLADVPTDLKFPSSSQRIIGGLPTTIFHQGTNGIVYQSVVVPVGQLPANQLDLLRLFTGLYTEVGCAGKSYLETQQWHASISGGVNAHFNFRGGVTDTDSGPAYFHLDISGLTRNIDVINDLLLASFWQVRFDERERLRELVTQTFMAREASVTDHGHTLAAAAAAAGINPIARAHHQWDGLHGLQHLKSLHKALSDSASLDELILDLEAIHGQLVQAPKQLLVIGEQKHEPVVCSALERCWSSHGLFSPQQPLQAPPAIPKIANAVAWLVNTEVNFCAKAYPAVPGAHPDAASLHVLGRFLHNGYLHRTIREQGGAYGSGASYDSDSGTFRFYSYRDPRLQKTLDDFDGALTWLGVNKHDDRQLEEAILGVISAIDRPGSPAGEAMKVYFSSLYGRTPAYLRNLRRDVLRVTLDDLRRVAATYLKTELAYTAVLTSHTYLKRHPLPEFDQIVL